MASNFLYTKRPSPLRCTTIFLQLLKSHLQKSSDFFLIRILLIGLPGNRAGICSRSQTVNLLLILPTFF